MISKKVFLRDIKSNKEFYIVKKSYMNSHQNSRHI